MVGSSANPFGMYQTEILRNEGLDAFTTLDASLLSSTVLSNFDVVLLGDTTLSTGQVTTLTNWVNGGGKLIAMCPDKKLAGLLGLATASGTLSNAYLKVDTSSGPGVGITAQTIQFHGSADRYTLNGATCGRDPLLERLDRGHGQPGSHPAARSARTAVKLPPSPTTSPARWFTRARATRPGQAKSATA